MCELFSWLVVRSGARRCSRDLGRMSKSNDNNEVRMTVSRKLPQVVSDHVYFVVMMDADDVLLILGNQCRLVGDFPRNREEPWHEMWSDTAGPTFWWTTWLAKTGLLTTSYHFPYLASNCQAQVKCAEDLQLEKYLLCLDRPNRRLPLILATAYPSRTSSTTYHEGQLPWVIGSSSYHRYSPRLLLPGIITCHG